MSTVRRLRHAAIVARDWRWLLFYFQRRWRAPATRKRIAHWIASLRPPPAHSSATDPAAAAALASAGIVQLGQLLDTEACSQVKSFFEKHLVADAYRPDLPPFLPIGGERHTHTHAAFHEPEDIVAAPHLLALANRPDILGLVESFLGCRPTIAYLAAWWSYPTSVGPQQAENFHRDVDDWRFVKLFVYLSDVGPDQGPHIYVQRSAGDLRLRKIRRFDDTEIAAAFASSDILTLTGSAGTGFVEDTNGVHKGQPVRTGTRLMFQAVYGLTPLPYGPKRPVARLADVALTLDPYVNRIYLRA